MKRLIKKLFVIGLVVSLALAAWLYITIDRNIEKQLEISSEQLIINVEKGDTLSKIIYSLQRDEVLTNPRYILWYAKINGLGNKIHIGEYRFNKGATYADLLEVLSTGKVVQYSLTLVEGWTFEQILQAVHDSPYITHTLKGKSVEEIMSAIGKPGEHPEGRFLPDTYHFPRGMSDVDFLKRSYDSMSAYLDEVWVANEDLPIKTPYEALILASIVEKETGVKSERGQIAGVFTRRLKRNMKLQTDPTVIYGLGKRYNGNLRKKDLSYDSPYNTYVYHGLPPTPIACPGREAIYAAINPEQGDTLYFVARGDGSHHFSATYEEHNKAVQKYQVRNRKPSSTYRSSPGQNQ